MKLKSTLYQICLVVITSFLSISVRSQSCQLTATATTLQSICKATGSITVTATNGSGNYNYIVTGPSYSSTTSTSIIDGLAPGTYSIKVKDINTGCTTPVDNIIVGGNYQDPRFQLVATDVRCTNGNDGTISVTGLQYGKAPFSYSIVAPSASGVGTTNSTGAFTNLIAGDYSIKMTDSCGGIQTRVITIANYNWSITSAPVTKLGCDSADVTINVSDNKGNTNASGTTFNGFLYGASKAPGDTVWSSNRSFRFLKSTARSITFVVKDLCGNSKTTTWFDNSKPSVSANVTISNKECTYFSATIAGQQNLTNPQYCLYTAANALVSCNLTGDFDFIPYGSYCITIRDNCYDTTITRCFTVAQPVPALAATVSISNLACNTFTATVTGQQNLTSPEYCLYDSVNAMVACNFTGVFAGIGYGSYCINITDGCTGTVITRCFTQRKLVPGVGSTVHIFNQTCNTFSANVTGLVNITNGQYCLYDVNGTQLMCNLTGIFDNLPYGDYCIDAKNDPACYDTTITRCFSVSPLVPSVGNSVNISNKICSGFTAKITGQQNLTNPQYCLYDNNNVQIICNFTGQFDNLAYGSYCIQIKNDGACFDTTMQRCFTVTQPVPSVGASVNISNKACSTFSVDVTGESNLTSPDYCLYDNTNTSIACNTNGRFDNVAYGSYCIKIVNTCYDTTISRCFTVNPVPLGLNVTSAASCTIGTTTLNVSISNGVAPYTINIYNPGGVLVSTTTTSSASANINGLSGLPTGMQYKVVVTGSCSSMDSTTIAPVASSLTKSINANSKCPGGQWLNGTGDLLVNAVFSGGTVTPKIIYKDATAVSINYSTQSGSNFTFSNLQPATYIVQYTLQGCGTIVKDTFDLDQYTYPSLDQSAVYQCNNNNISVSAAVTGGIPGYSYEIIGSNPSNPSILRAPQASPAFAINNGTKYSVVRLRVIDACGNATINDASILPLGNTLISASSDCFYNEINLTVDTIPNATYTWYKKTSPTDSTLIGSNQSHTISYMLPSDTGVYVSVMSVNSGCLTKVSSFHITGACGGQLLAANGLSFTGFLDKENVQLKWTTAKGFAADKFIIERSTDGLNFKDIGTMNVAANNNTTISQYYFSDISAAPGNIFYRLHIVKSNRPAAYSNVIEISRKGKASISVMPNPVVDAFNINFHQASGTNYNIRLASAEGRILFNNNYAVRPSESKTIQRPQGAVTGVYFLLIRNLTSNEQEVIKLFFK
jgi:hypothetical protein